MAFGVQYNDGRYVTASGYNGTRCEVNADDCVDVVCVHGSCVDGADNYSCRCEAGYTGRLCQLEVDECADQPCRNGGTCVDRLDDFTCVCPNGTTGKSMWLPIF